MHFEVRSLLQPLNLETWHRCLRDEVFCAATAVANLAFYLWHVWGCYVVMIVNSKGVWKDVLSEIYEAYLRNPPSISPHSIPPPLRLTVLYAKPTVWGWSRGVAAQSGATATLATTTRYMITDHRHAPSKHSTTAAQIRGYNPGCLSAFLPLT